MPSRLLNLNELSGYTQANPYSVPFGGFSRFPSLTENQKAQLRRMVEGFQVSPGPLTESEKAMWESMGRRFERAPVEAIENLTPEQRQEFLGAILPDRPIDSIPDPRFTQGMTPVAPTLRDRLEMFASDAFGSDPRGRRRQDTFRNTVDVLDPGFQILSDAHSAFGRGDYLSSAVQGGLGALGVVPGVGPAVRTAGRAWAKNQKPLADFIARQDVIAKPELFGGVLGGQFTKYARTDASPAARRRDAMRLAALEEVGPSQFGEGGFRLGELGTEGIVAPIQRPIIKPEEFMGRQITPVFGDRSPIRQLTKIGGVPLDRIVEAQGGPGFPLTFGGWASNRQAASNVYNTAVDAARFDDNPVGIYAGMGAESLPFTNATVESMLAQLEAIGIPKATIADFNRSVRNTEVKKDGKVTKPFKNFIGLDNPDVLDQLLGRGEFIGQSADMRKAVVAEMGKAERRMQGFPVYSDVESALTMRELANINTGDAGFSLFGINPRAGLTDETFHHTYDTRIPGQSYGGFAAPVSSRTMFPKSYELLDQAKNKYGQVLTEGQKRGTLQLGQFHETVDQQWVDTVSEAIEQGNPYTADVSQGFKFPSESPFGRGRAVRSTAEQIPGAGTGHMEGITRADPEVREQYSNITNWMTEGGRDALYQAQGMPVEQSVFGRGLYEPHGLPAETNPMIVGRPITTDMQAVRATEAARAYVDAQNAGAAHRILPLTETKPAERVDLDINVAGIDMTEEQMIAIRDIGKKHGYFPIDSGDRLILKNFDENRPGAMAANSRLGESDRAKVQAEIRSVIPDAQLSRQLVDSDTAYVEYQELFKEALAGKRGVTENMFSILNERPDVRASIEPVVKRKARDNLARDANAEKTLGYKRRPDVTRALEILVDKGFDGLEAALKSKAVLPAVAATILAPSFLDNRQDR